MADLSPAQIASYAYQAGFHDETALTRAVAVALAESGGNPLAVNVNSDSQHSRDRGLWQINAYWHPEVSDAAAFDPAQAAAATYRISSGGKSWSQWSTWNNGAATAQLGRARLGAAAAIQSGGAQAGGTVPADLTSGVTNAGLTDGFSDALKAFSDFPKIALAIVKAGVWIADPHNWLRVLEVVAGVGVAVIGMRLLADTGVGGPVGAIATGTKKAGDAAFKAAKTAATKGAEGNSGEKPAPQKKAAAQKPAAVKENAPEKQPRGNSEKGGKKNDSAG